VVSKSVIYWFKNSIVKAAFLGCVRLISVKGVVTGKNNYALFFHTVVTIFLSSSTDCTTICGFLGKAEMVTTSPISRPVALTLIFLLLNKNSIFWGYWQLKKACKQNTLPIAYLRLTALNVLGDRYFFLHLKSKDGSKGKDVAKRETTRLKKYKRLVSITFHVFII
jgi:hypothetical protein